LASSNSKGIAPGNYKLFAWEEIEDGAWQSSDFRKNYVGQGTAVHVEAGGRTATVGDLSAIPQQ
jgi:hypothetical protein